MRRFLSHRGFLHNLYTDMFHAEVRHLRLTGHQVPRARVYQKDHRNQRAKVFQDQRRPEGRHPKVRSAIYKLCNSTLQDPFIRHFLFFLSAISNTSTGGCSTRHTRNARNIILLDTPAHYRLINPSQLQDLHHQRLRRDQKVPLSLKAMVS
jgi:hypothetical protein